MLRNKKGIAMIIVVSMVLMLLALAGAALMLSVGHHGTSFHQINRARVVYAAEGAIQQALWMCRTDNLPGAATMADGPWPAATTITINDPNYSIDVDIEIWGPGTTPSQTGITAPAGVHPIVAEVDY